MFTRRIFQIVLLTLTGLGRGEAEHSQSTTTCEEFERGARFNSYDITDSKWKIIYFWSETTEIRPIIFSLVDKKKINKFKTVVDALEPDLKPEWHKATLMMEPRPGVQVLLLYMGTPGAFRGIVKMEQRHKGRPYPPPYIKLADLRFKLVERYMGMMCCEDLTAFVFVRVDEVPSTELECVGVASLLGLRGPGGRSYLYVKNLTRTDL
ncbi:uncharacterized protein [Maniola hyperantus]|uniref:uncharacterized protein n=1 Tax=Aphantopus hyperantus TaxID=2795564 RepID=UPI0037492649